MALSKLLLILSVGVTTLSTFTVTAFHDCIEASAKIREGRRRRHHQHFGIIYEDDVVINNNKVDVVVDDENHNNKDHNETECAGGICIGMKNGPHEGGNASYPIAWNSHTSQGTFVKSTMIVPKYPRKLDGITYYLWTDIFFGDGGLGKMNQFVPQLLLGDVLQGSTGYPNYNPKWGFDSTWVFGAHYFFEIYNPITNQTEPHAAYGDLYPTIPGETLFTSFGLKKKETKVDETGMAVSDDDDVQWILTMGVVGDNSRISTLVVERPYMGMGTQWTNQSTTSWLEPSYQNMCINACWEIYGGKDANHLPSSGTRYNLTIVQPQSTSQSNDDTYYNFTSWERDEGKGKCPSCHIQESHTDQIQTVQIDIGVGSKSPDGHETASSTTL